MIPLRSEAGGGAGQKDDEAHPPIDPTQFVDTLEGIPEAFASTFRPAGGLLPRPSHPTHFVDTLEDVLIRTPLSFDS